MEAYGLLAGFKSRRTLYRGSLGCHPRHHKRSLRVRFSEKAVNLQWNAIYTWSYSRKRSSYQTYVSIFVPSYYDALCPTQVVMLLLWALRKNQLGVPPDGLSGLQLRDKIDRVIAATNKPKIPIPVLVTNHNL